MSRTVDKWAGRTDDTPPPARVKARIIARQDGICDCGCGVKLGVAGEPIEFDHEQPLILCGANDEDNLRALRKPCHKVKTKSDVRQKSVEARKRHKHLGIANETRAVIPGSRRSKFKRKIGGQTVRREDT